MTVADHDTGIDYFVYVREVAGPVASFYAQVPADKKAAVDREVATRAEEMGNGRAVLPGVSWVAAGTK